MTVTGPHFYGSLGSAVYFRGRTLSAGSVTPSGAEWIVEWDLDTGSRVPVDARYLQVRNAFHRYDSVVINDPGIDDKWYGERCTLVEWNVAFAQWEVVMGNVGARPLNPGRERAVFKPKVMELAPPESDAGAASRPGGSQEPKKMTKINPNDNQYFHLPETHGSGRP